MRRLVIFLTLIILLAAAFQLSRLVQNWHYVISGEPGELLYATTFDTFPEDWEVYDERNLAQIVDGAMQIYLAQAGRIVYSATKPYFDDFDITVDTQAISGAEDNAYGVVFRQRDRNNLYAFLISSNGYYSLERTIDGSTKPLSQWFASDLINQGLNAVNRLRVVAFDDRFQFYINGERVDLCIPDNPNAVSTIDVQGGCMEGQWLDTLTDDSLRYGRLAVGIKADPSVDVTVAFDNIIVYGAQPIAK